MADACIGRLTDQERLHCRPVALGTGYSINDQGRAAPEFCQAVLAKLMRCLNGDRFKEGSVARSAFGVTPMFVTSQSVGTRASKANALNVKVGGLGSTATAPRQSKTGDLGALIGGAVGGERGETIGRIGGEVLDFIVGSDRPTSGGASVNNLVGPSGSGGCPAGRVQIGSTCVDLMALPPGGVPATVPTSGTMVAGGGAAVIGAFGLPARQPMVESRLVRKCGQGMVLGADNLCYPKAVLGRRNRFRKWKGAARPPVTAADARAIRRADRTRERVLELAKDVGLHASKSRPRPKKK